MPNPLAPISHHWLDSTHVTFGVVTAGVYGNRWKAEASVFNGREPDEKRTNFDFGALDSVSGRLWFLPTSKLALQVSAGRLTEAEASENGGPGIDVTRVDRVGDLSQCISREQHLGDDARMGTQRGIRPRLQCSPARNESHVRRSRHVVRQIRGGRQDRA